MGGLSSYWRGAWLRPAAEIQYRQTPHAFIVPPGLHAVRPDPKHAGKPLAPVDGNLHRHAGCSAPVQEGIWSDLKYEGSLEGSCPPPARCASLRAVPPAA